MISRILQPINMWGEPLIMLLLDYLRVYVSLLAE